MHLLLFLPGLVWGHGAVVHPPPRNRVNKLTKTWSGGWQRVQRIDDSPDLPMTRLTAGFHPGPDQCLTLSLELMHGPFPVSTISSFQLKFVWLRIILCIWYCRCPVSNGTSLTGTNGQVLSRQNFNNCETIIKEMLLCIKIGKCVLLFFTFWPGLLLVF